MNSDFMKSFSKDPETLKQAEHIWKMLDEMSQNDPDQYKKFVENNIKEGTKDLKKKAEEDKAKQKDDPKQKAEQKPVTVQYKETQMEEDKSKIEQNLQGLFGIKEENIKKTDASKKVLIQEIESKEEPQQLEQPQYQLTTQEKFIELTIFLPNVDNFNEIDLVISETQLKLIVSEKYSLEIKFTCKINNNQPQAKWSKKQKQLNLQLAKK